MARLLVVRLVAPLFGGKRESQPCGGLEVFMFLVRGLPWKKPGGPRREGRSGSSEGNRGVKVACSEIPSVLPCCGDGERVVYGVVFLSGFSPPPARLQWKGLCVHNT